MVKSQGRWFGVLLLLIFMLAVGGCGSKINQENFKKIEIGMSFNEVVAILGEPVQCQSTLGVQNCDWGEAPRTINIKFMADNVVFRSSEGLN